MRAAPRRLDKLLARFDRAAAGRGVRRFVTWGSALLVGGAYITAFVLSRTPGGLAHVARWSLAAVAILPMWAALVAAILCGTAVAAEAQRGTLDALRLLPMVHTEEILEARYRRRRRVAFGILALGAGFYLLSPVMAPLSGRRWFQTALSLYLGSDVFTGRWIRFLTGRDVIGVLLGLTIDITRVYAIAALSMAISLRARSNAQALLGAVAVSIGWILGAVGLEVGTAYLFGRVPPRQFFCFGPGVGTYLVLIAVEPLFWHVYVPRRILRYARRNFEKWCEP